MADLRRADAVLGVLLSMLLVGMWAAVGASRSGAIDSANLGWLGRSLFVGFSVVQMLLAIIIAPLTTAAAVIEEADERTMEMLVLTPLRPGQILGAKVLSRIGVLITVVCGALPVMAMVVNLGGVGTYEVIAVTVHTLTTVVVMAALGAFFGLFTRSPALAMMASASYAIPFFGLVPLAYVIVAGADPALAPQFSTFTSGLATGPSAWITPLSYLPSLVVIMGLATPLFQLKVSNADIRHAFSDSLWHTTAWVKAAVILVAIAIPTIPIAGMGAWLDPKSAPMVVLETLSIAWIWLLFVALTALATWAFLRVGTDVVDGLDGLLSGTPTGPASERKSLKVGRNPVMWREARPRAWGATATPMLVTWGLIMLAVFQTGWWIFPGGVLAIGAANAAAAVLFAVWLGSRAIAEERRRGTLEVLMVTTAPARSIVAGKFAGAAMPTTPLLLLSLPLLAFGMPHLQMLLDEAGQWAWWGVIGVGIWAWVLPVWALAIAASMTIATRSARPQGAFPIVAAVLIAWFGVPAVLAHAFPNAPFIVWPCRLISPPLSGGFGLIELGCSALLYAVAAVAVLVGFTTKLRDLVGTLVVLLAVGVGAGIASPALADAPPDPKVIAALEKANLIRMRARPMADGIVREGRFTAVSVWVENAGPGTTGTLSISERGADGVSSTTYHRDVELPQGSRKQVQMLLKPGIGDRWRVIDLQTRDGRIGKAPFQLQPVEASAVTVAVVGADPLGLPATLRDATGEAVPGRIYRPHTDARSVRVGVVAPEDLPSSFAGYDAIDWVVWPAADPSGVRPEALAAMVAWASDGGHLLLTASDTWRQVAGSAVGEALPIALDGVSDRSVDPLAKILLGSGRGSAPVATGRLRPERSPFVRARTPLGDTPLWVSAPYGLGSVHIVLADLSTRPLAVRGSERAWRRLLTLAPAGGRADDQLAQEHSGVAGPRPLDAPPRPHRALRRPAPLRRQRQRGGRVGDPRAHRGHPRRRAAAHELAVHLRRRLPHRHRAARLLRPAPAAAPAPDLDHLPRPDRLVQRRLPRDDLVHQGQPGRRRPRRSGRSAPRREPRPRPHLARRLLDAQDHPRPARRLPRLGRHPAARARLPEREAHLRRRGPRASCATTPRPGPSLMPAATGRAPPRARCPCRPRPITGPCATTSASIWPTWPCRSPTCARAASPGSSPSVPSPTGRPSNCPRCPTTRATCARPISTTSRAIWAGRCAPSPTITPPPAAACGRPRARSSSAWPSAASSPSS